MMIRLTYFYMFLLAAPMFVGDLSLTSAQAQVTPLADSLSNQPSLPTPLSKSDSDELTQTEAPSDRGTYESRSAPFVETNVADLDWVLVTSDLILTSKNCMPNWYDKPFSPCYSYNRYWKFSPGKAYGVASPMNVLGVGTFDGLFVRDGYMVGLYQGTGFDNPYGPTDVCGVNHALPLVGPQYASQCFWKNQPHNPDPNNYDPGTYFTAGEAGALASDSIVVGVPLDVKSMNWEDGLTTAGAEIDNNFDIRADSGGLLVPGYGAEWVDPPPGGKGKSTCYIRDTRVRAEVTFESDPAITNESVELEVYSEEEIDLTPQGTAEHEVTLNFDAQGQTSHTFTAFQTTVGNEIDLIDFTIEWKGAADDEQVIQPVYVLYDEPCDNWNGAAPPHEPTLYHLKMLLGPTVAGAGEWANGTTSLAKLDLPHEVQKGVFEDGIFSGGGGSCGDPWNVVRSTTGGVCEDFAELMKQALLVIGVPEAILDRKSVVSSMVTRPTWFGRTREKKLIKAFREEAGGTIWINEGVCGVDTDDENWRYYDVAAIDDVANAANYIGVGGWATPDDPSNDNLWYEPPDGQHGPIMYEIVKDLYGYWSPTTTPPYERVIHRLVGQAKVTSLTAAGANLIVEYRTEGAKDRGQDVRIQLFEQGNSTPVATEVKPIASEWDNQQSHTFGPLTAGTYKVKLNIRTAGGTSYVRVWEADSGWRTVSP